MPHRRPRGVANLEAGALGRGASLRKPAHHGVEILSHDGPVVRPADHVAPPDIDVVGQSDGDGLWRKRLDQQVATRAANLRNGAGIARRQDDDLVSLLEHTAGHGAGIPAVVVQVGISALVGPDDVLDREAGHRSGCGRRRCARARGGGAAECLRTNPSRRLRLTMLSPWRADMGTNARSWISSLVAKAPNSWRSSSYRRWSQSTRSILLMHTTMWGMPSRLAMNAWRRDCSSTPLRASMRISATSAVEAPVTMLRVYCTCPGVSAMMNFRRGVAKYL